MADIIIGDEDNFGKTDGDTNRAVISEIGIMGKGVIVKVIDPSTLPTNNQGKILYQWPHEDTLDNHIALNRNPDLNWNKTTTPLDIVRQQQLLSRKHLEPKVDVIIDQVDTLTPESREASKALLKKWEVDGYRPFPSLLAEHRSKLKKDVVVDKSIHELFVDYKEHTVSKSMIIKLSEKPPSAKRCKLHQTIVDNMLKNKPNPDDVIVE